MQHAKADAISRETGARFAIKRIVDAPRLVPRDSSLPEVVDAPLLAARLETQAKGLLGQVSFQMIEMRPHGSPMLISDRPVDRSDDFVIAQTDVPQEARSRVENHGQWPRSQMDQFR